MADTRLANVSPAAYNSQRPSKLAVWSGSAKGGTFTFSVNGERSVRSSISLVTFSRLQLGCRSAVGREKCATYETWLFTEEL